MLSLFLPEMWGFGECFWEVLKLCPTKSCAVLFERSDIKTVEKIVAIVKKVVMCNQDNCIMFKFCVQRAKAFNHRERHYCTYYSIT